MSKTGLCLALQHFSTQEQKRLEPSAAAAFDSGCFRPVAQPEHLDLSGLEALNLFEKTSATIPNPELRSSIDKAFMGLGIRMCDNTWGFVLWKLKCKEPLVAKKGIALHTRYA